MQSLHRITLTWGIKYLRQDGQPLFWLWRVLVTGFSGKTHQTTLLIKSYNPTGLCSCVIRLLSVPSKHWLPWQHHLHPPGMHPPYHCPCFVCPARSFRTTPIKMCIDQGLCWGHPRLPACLASGSSPALDAPWHMWPLQHVYAPLLLITLNHMQNISRLSLVCAKACHMWPFLYLHEHFILTIYKSLIYAKASQFCTGTIWGVSERARFSTQDVNQHIEQTDWSGHNILPEKILETVWNSDLESSSANNSSAVLMSRSSANKLISIQSIISTRQATSRGISGRPLELMT